MKKLIFLHEEETSLIIKKFFNVIKYCDATKLEYSEQRDYLYMLRYIFIQKIINT